MRSSGKRSGTPDHSQSTHAVSESDENSVAPEASAETSLREQALCDLLDQLSYRERRVLELRYGLRGEKPRTLDELGRMFNVTRERIRQVESQSLQKLGSLPDSGRLG